jgi:RNA polymerase sigma-70 factor (ECF subfamily)
MAHNIDWEAVFTAEISRVYQFFRYRVGDRLLAEDLTATTFERAWKSRGRYRPGQALVYTWLIGIARNVVADYYRQRRPQASLEEIPDYASTESVEELVQHQSDVVRLMTLLGYLTPRERELIALKYGAQLTNREIARVAGLTETNVGTMLYRIVRRLRHGWEEAVE